MIRIIAIERNKNYKTYKKNKLFRTKKNRFIGFFFIFAFLIKMIVTIFFNKKNIRKVLPFLILLFIAILGYWQIALFRHPLKWDIIDQAFPWKYFIGECLQNHTLPLWNPYQHCGYPIHADPQSSSWYPITWFFGYFWGYSIYVLSVDFILHIFLAGSGMLILGRKIGFNKKIAFIMGTAYMFSGFFVGNAQHFMWIISGTWLPFILFAYIDMYEKRKLKQAIIFGLLMFLIITGGYPAFIMILLYLLIILFIVYSIKILNSEGKSSLFHFIKINILALIFSITNSIVMLLSIYKLMPELTRTGGISLEDALFGPLSPQCLISFFIPFGVVNHDMSFFGTDLSMSNAYFGLFLIIFFIASLFMKKPPLIKIFLFWGLFMLLAAVGRALPVREFLFHYIPFFNIFRFPALLRIFVIISFIILAGFALNEYVENQKKYVKKINIAIYIVGGLILLIMAIFSFGEHINLRGYITDGNLFTFSDNSSIAQQLFFQGIVQLTFIVLFFILIKITRNVKKQLSFLMVLIIADMIFTVQLNAPYTVFEKGFYQKDIYETINKLPVGFPPPPMKTVITTNDNTAPHFFSMWRNLNIFYKEIAFDGNNATHLRNYVFLEDSLLPAFKATLNNPPLYFGSRFFSNKIIAEKTWSDIDSSMVFLPSEDLQNINPGIPHNKDKISFTGFSPNEIQFETNTKGERFAVVLQNKYYGWETKIDGVETKNISTNICFMGVSVPPGEHKITLSFKPKLVIIGFYLSLISLIISIIMLLDFKVWNQLIRKNKQ